MNLKDEGYENINDLLSQLITKYQKGEICNDIQCKEWYSKILILFEGLSSFDDGEKLFKFKKELKNLFSLLEYDKKTPNSILEIVADLKDIYPFLNPLYKNKKKWNKKWYKKITKNNEIITSDNKVITLEEMNEQNIDSISLIVSRYNKTFTIKSELIKIYYDGTITKNVIYKLQDKEEDKQLWNDFFQKALNDLDNK